MSRWRYQQRKRMRRNGGNLNPGAIRPQVPRAEADRLSTERFQAFAVEHPVQARRLLQEHGKDPARAGVALDKRAAER